MPPVMLPDVRAHLDSYTAPGPDAQLFTSPAGRPLRHGNFRRRGWLPSLATCGLDLHVHDLRHTGNGLVAEAGANLRELMERSGTFVAAALDHHRTADHHMPPGQPDQRSPS